MSQTNIDSFLQHYGVKGMRWGVINDDPRVAKANERLKQVLEDANKGPKIALAIGKKGIAKSNKIALTNLDIRNAKEDLHRAKVLAKLDLKPKSDYQLKMEAHYKSKGMTKDEAAVAAHDNIRTKKILAAVAGTAVVAAAGYAAYKIHDDRVDKVIKEGKLLKRVEVGDSKAISDAFFASGNRWDKVKYSGEYANFLGGEGANVHQKSLRALTDIRQASPRNARRILANALNEEEFRKGVVKQFNIPVLETMKYMLQ